MKGLEEARAHFAAGQWAETVASATRVIGSDRRNREAVAMRAQSLIHLSRIPEAVHDLRAVLELGPAPDVHSSLLWHSAYLGETTPESLFRDACEWGRRYGQQDVFSTHPNKPDPDRRIRIGYVSPDLYQHAIMKFLPPVLERFDRDRFSVHVYAVGERCDPKIRQWVENYVCLPEDPRQIAGKIREDQIDILVDLAGHTNWRSLRAFALKPAPIQVAWLGCMFTSGLAEMDYFLGDEWVPAPGTERYFSEKIYRMDGACCCYRPFRTLPLQASPCLRGGHVTFGCFNSPFKITAEVVDVWAAVLHAVPGSRMLLKYRDLDNVALQRPIRALFAARGVAQERLEFESESGDLAYMESYNRIDIALDPFPYGGGSTTFDTLWMGVPLVTMTGPLPVQRASAGVLHAMGLGGTVAHSPEQYVQMAVLLSKVAQQAPDIRVNTREALRRCSLMDEVGLMERLEKAYRDIWRTWCVKKRSSEYELTGILSVAG